MGLFNISLIYVHCAEKKQRKHIILGENVATLQFFSVLVKSYIFIHQT